MCLYHWSDISEMSAYCHHNTTLSTPAAPHPPADYLHLSALTWLLVRIMFTTGSSLIRAAVEVICLVSPSNTLWKSPLWSLFKGGKVKKRAEVTSWEQWETPVRTSLIPKNLKSQISLCWMLFTCVKNIGDHRLMGFCADDDYSSLLGLFVSQSQSDKQV